jgi:2-methylisocitrate lyase-like PEP mutase family enzyme
MQTQAQKAQRFAELHAGSAIFVMPNPWDAGSARILAGHGFEALATTSAGAAFSMGYPDGGIDLDATLENARQIVEAVDVPVSADLMDCFAPTPEGVAETVRRAAGIGLAGCSVEDARTGPEGGIRDKGEAVERVAAAVEAARGLGQPFVLTARAENYLHGRPDLDDTIARLQAYEAAGADCLYAPGLPDLASIRAVVSALAKPVNVVIGIGAATPTVAELAEAGVRRISVGGALARLALGALIDAAAVIRDTGRFEYAGRAAGFAEVSAFMRNSDG